MVLDENEAYQKVIRPELLTHLSNRGIADFYPPQWKALQAGLTGQNLIVAIPTASGKTLIGEIIALQKMLTLKATNQYQKKKRPKILYLCPLRALASEKFQEFQQTWRKLGFQVGISTSDIDKPDYRVFQKDLIILTNEKADAILRQNHTLIQQIEVVICDEIHLINDDSRGITLEFLLTLLKTVKPSLQIIGLSATIKNANELAMWLDAALIKSDWRPVQLREGFFLKNEIQFQDGNTRRIPEKIGMTPTQQLVVDMIEEGGQVLVFANSRASAMATAEKLAPILHKMGTPAENQQLTALQTEYRDKIEDDTGIAKRLGKMIYAGVAFHHAGLGSKQLNYVVSQFNAHIIKVICCTPTLAAGVNTPARRVIIKTLYRFSSDLGSHLIPIIEYKQMAGRAGRPRYDPYGEVVVLGNNPDRLMQDAIAFINGTPEAISSKLSNQNKLQSHILGLMAAKLITNKPSITDFLSKTFYYYQLKQNPYRNNPGDSASAYQNPIQVKQLIRDHKQRRKISKKQGRGTDPLGMFDSSRNLFTTADQLRDENQDKIFQTAHESAGKSSNEIPINNDNQVLLGQKIDQLLSFFVENEFITIDQENSEIEISKFGKITSQTYLPAQDTIILRQDLNYAQRLVNNHELELNTVSWLHLTTKLESSQKFYLKKADHPIIHSFLEDQWDNLIMEQIWTPSDYEFPDFAQELKLTMVLRDWINEVHERNITENYQIGSGDLYRVVSIAQWIFRAFTKIVDLDAPHLSNEIKDLSLRIAHGIKPSLIPFIKITGVGRMRARKLFHAGFTTLQKLKEATIDDIANVPLIGDTLAKSIFNQIHHIAEKKPKNSKKTKRTQITGRVDPIERKNQVKTYPKKQIQKKNSLDRFFT